MKKTFLLAPTLLFLLLALTSGCDWWKASPQQKSREADKKTSETGDKARQVFDDHSETHSMQESVDHTVEWLEKQSGVEKVVKGEGSIVVQFEEGTDVLIPTDPRVWPKQ